MPSDPVERHRPDLVICVATPNRNAYSETFIEAHIRQLPARISVLYGSGHGFSREDGTLLSTPVTSLRRVSQGLERRIRRLAWLEFQELLLKRFLIRTRVDVVLAEYGTTGVHLMDACHSVGIPLVVHFHGFDAYNRRVLDGIGQRYPELFHVAVGIIAVSRHMEKQLLQLGALRQTLCYNPYGVDVSLFRGADPLRAPPLFVSVGRFVDKKAPLLTLLAFADVFKEVPAARLAMIGDGPLLESSKQLAHALGLGNAVDFRGARPHVEVAITMQRARAFVQHSLQTSYGDSEGTPVAVLEASATGLPVISTRHAGIAEVVLDGETGLLVEEGDVDRMARAMLLVAGDAELAHRLGSAARKRIEEQFTMESSIDGLWRIIEAAIGSR